MTTHHQGSAISGPRPYGWGLALVRWVSLLAWPWVWVQLFGPMSLIPGMVLTGGVQMVGLTFVVLFWAIGLLAGWGMIGGLMRHRQTPVSASDDRPYEERVIVLIQRRYD